MKPIPYLFMLLAFTGMLLGIVTHAETNPLDLVDLASSHTTFMHLKVMPKGTFDLDGKPGSLATATNQIATATNLDGIALYFPSSNNTPESMRENMLQKLTKKGVYIFLVEGEEPDTYKQKSIHTDPRTLTLSSEQISRLLGSAYTLGSKAPSLEMALHQSDEDNHLSMHRMQMGIPGRKVWLVHELNDEEEKSAVQFKKSW